jgi:hypothetical protein
MLTGWAPLKQLWWLWLCLGLSGGLGISLQLLAPPQAISPTTMEDGAKTIPSVPAPTLNTTPAVRTLPEEQPPFASRPEKPSIMTTPTLGARSFVAQLRNFRRAEAN